MSERLPSVGQHPLPVRGHEQMHGGGWNVVGGADVVGEVVSRSLSRLDSDGC